MIKILMIQLAALIVVAAFSGVLGGSAAFWSAVAGGGCYFVPTVLMVLVLNFFQRSPVVVAYGFVLGEGLKITLALGLMVAVFWFYRDHLMFIPFFLGLLGVSQAFFLLFLKVKSYGR